MGISGFSALDYAEKLLSGSNPFRSDVKWALIFMSNSPDFSADDNGVIGNAPSSGDYNFRGRFDKGSGGENFEARTSGELSFVGSGDYDVNTWYALMITNDGTGGAGGMRKWGATLDAIPSYIDNNLVGEHNGDPAGTLLTVNIGCSRAGGNSEYHRGSLAHIGYYEGSGLTIPGQSDLEDFIANPYDFFNTHSASCIFQLDTTSTAGGQLTDRSGNGNHFPIIGTLSAVADPVLWDAGSVTYNEDLTLFATSILSAADLQGYLEDLGLTSGQSQLITDIQAYLESAPVTGTAQVSTLDLKTSAEHLNILSSIVLYEIDRQLYSESVDSTAAGLLSAVDLQSYQEPLVLLATQLVSIADTLSGILEENLGLLIASGVEISERQTYLNDLQITAAAAIALADVARYVDHLQVTNTSIDQIIDVQYYIEAIALTAAAQISGSDEYSGGLLEALASLQQLTVSVTDSQQYRDDVSLIITHLVQLSDGLAGLVPENIHHAFRRDVQTTFTKNLLRDFKKHIITDFEVEI